MKKVAVILGSASDLPVAKEALNTLADFYVPALARVLSAHRTPDDLAAFARNASDEGYGVLIAFAGKAAHLAGALAAHSLLPVIGVPVSGKDLGGLDALLSTVQMPKGVPVATVSIDGAVNAAILAIRILATNDDNLMKKLADYARDSKVKAAQADAEVQKEIDIV